MALWCALNYCKNSAVHGFHLIFRYMSQWLFGKTESMSFVLGHFFKYSKQSRCQYSEWSLMLTVRKVVLFVMSIKSHS